MPIRTPPLRETTHERHVAAPCPAARTGIGEVTVFNTLKDLAAGRQARIVGKRRCRNGREGGQGA